jgi:hypothetical protein
MPQWEYNKIDLSNVSARSDDVDLLDDAGKDGWELVGITSNNVAYLKRMASAPVATATTEAPAKPVVTRRKAAT